MGDWQPIRLAPRDGRRLICRGDNPSFLYEAEFRQGVWWRDNRGYGFVCQCHPDSFLAIEAAISPGSDVWSAQHGKWVPWPGDTAESTGQRA